jgi:hypothetical protein
MDSQERDIIIAKLISEGNSLSEVQKVLKKDYDYKITYMDLRLVSSSLEVNWEKLDEKNNPKTDDDDDTDDTDKPELIPSEETIIEVSKLVRPGAVYSGNVTFLSGIKAEWHIDSMGRLGLNPKNEGDQPTEADFEDFQLKLQDKIQS